MSFAVIFVRVPVSIAYLRVVCVLRDRATGAIPIQGEPSRSYAFRLVVKNRTSICCHSGRKSGSAGTKGSTKHGVVVVDRNQSVVEHTTCIRQLALTTRNRRQTMNNVTLDVFTTLCHGSHSVFAQVLAVGVSPRVWCSQGIADVKEGVPSDDAKHEDTPCERVQRYATLLHSSPDMPCAFTLLVQKSGTVNTHKRGEREEIEEQEATRKQERRRRMPPYSLHALG